MLGFSNSKKDFESRQSLYHNIDEQRGLIYAAAAEEERENVETKKKQHLIILTYMKRFIN